ncbi:unnamed protein product, partial [Didymodactylos carnosus]
MSEEKSLSVLLGLTDAISELETLEEKLDELYLLNERAAERKYRENVQLIISSIDDLFRSNYSLLKSTPYEKRQLFIESINQKVDRIKDKVVKVNEIKQVEFNDRITHLKLLSNTRFDEKPLQFAKECVRYMYMLSSFEIKLCKLLDEPIVKCLFENTYHTLTNARNKVVIAALGILKSAKSSFINFLLEDEICPTGDEAATARLTKITYGERMKLVHISANGKPSEPRYFHSKQDLLAEAVTLIKPVTMDERLEGMNDEIVIELPLEELKNIELWDIPGLDENKAIDARVKEIVESADVIFGIIPHRERLRQSFQEYMKPHLKINRNFDQSDADVNNSAQKMVCFIVTLIDTFTVNNQTKKSRDTVLQELFDTFKDEMPIELGSDVESSNNFISMCALDTYAEELCTLLHKQIEETLLTALSEQYRAIIAKIYEKSAKYDHLNVHLLSDFVKNKKGLITELYLDLLNAQFMTIYPKFNITNNKLGESNFQVFTGNIVTKDGDTREMAAKKIPLKSFNIQEVRYMKSLCHTNIVEYYGVKKSETEANMYYLIMEKLDSDLETYVGRKKHIITVPQISEIFGQIAEGLKELHHEQLIHRDLKPANILVKETNQPLFKLADFGLVHCDPISFAGTRGFMAPEFVNKNLGPITEKSDV